MITLEMARMIVRTSHQQLAPLEQRRIELQNRIQMMKRSWQYDAVALPNIYADSVVDRKDETVFIDGRNWLRKGGN